MCAAQAADAVSQPADASDAARLRGYVAEVLHARATGEDAGPYHELISHLQQARKAACNPAGSDSQSQQDLAALLDAIGGCANKLLEPKHGELLTELLSVLPWDAPPLVRAGLMRLILNLVVTRAAWVVPCIRLLAANLTPPPRPGHTPAPLGPWTPDAAAVETQADIVDTLQRVVSLVPTCVVHVRQLIREQRPHKVRDKTAHCLYLRAACALAEGPVGRHLQEGVLCIAVDHLLDIDVEIRWEAIMDILTGEEGEEGTSEEEEEPEMFGMDGTGGEAGGGQAEGLQDGEDGQSDPLARLARQVGGRGGWEGLVQQAVAEHVAAAPSAEERQSAQIVADKLDSLMEVVLTHIKARVSQGDAQAVFEVLMGCFEGPLIRTHRCKFTPYILFYILGVGRGAPGEAASFPLVFTQRLVALLQSTSAPAELRAASAAYLASYMARAAYLSPQLVLATLSEVAAWALNYCKAVDSRAASGASCLLQARTIAQEREISWQKHEVLFAAVQALLYVLCYTLRGEGGTQLADLVRGPINQLLSHRLAPLRVCLPSVVLEFHRQTAALGLLDITALLPVAAWGEGPTAGGPKGEAEGRAMQRAQRRLEMFFPFDPYLLRRSAHMLDLGDTYVVWRRGQASAAGTSHASGGGARGGESSSSASSSSSGSDSEGESSTSGSDGSDASSDHSSLQDRFGSSSMGISPSPLSYMAASVAPGFPRPVPVGQAMHTGGKRRHPEGSQGRGRGRDGWLGSSHRSSGHGMDGGSYSCSGSDMQRGMESPLGSSPTGVPTPMAWTPEVSSLQQHMASN